MDFSVLAIFKAVVGGQESLLTEHGMGESISNGVLSLFKPVVDTIFDISKILDGGLLQNSSFVFAVGRQSHFFYHLFDVTLR